MSKYWWKPKGIVPKYATEEWVKKQVKDQLAKLNIQWFMPQGQNGEADFICCALAHYISIETKKLDGNWRVNQQFFAKDVADAGGVYIVVDETGLMNLWCFLTNWVFNNILPPGIHDYRNMQIYEEEKKIVLPAPKESTNFEYRNKIGNVKRARE